MQIMGHEFKPMTSDDWDGFAGATEGTLICALDSCILLYDPSAREIIEVLEDGDERRWHLATNSVLEMAEQPRRYQISALEDGGTVWAVPSADGASVARWTSVRRDAPSMLRGNAERLLGTLLPTHCSVLQDRRVVEVRS